jgi:uncharacterized lipoprotein YddW (UPF0748 family)
MIPIKRFNKEGNITYFRSDREVLIPDRYVEKEEETRGVWFSTVANIDLPMVESVESSQRFLLSVIDKVKEYNLNTIIFQVRPCNDAMYESEVNPWSEFLTGRQGVDPGFDVFGWFVERATAAGIEVHAWLNPYRVTNKKLSDLNMTKSEYLETLAEKNFARLHPELVIETVQNKLILDPASEEVREFVAESALEIARKYNVKAIHMDDYFYPYEAIIDDTENDKFLASGFEKLGDYRRDNINRLIKKMSDKLKTLPRKVEFGISPFGIYRTNSKWFDKPSEAAWEKGSDNHPTCLTCYAGLYADIYHWMQMGWIDYVVPQNYFEFDYWRTTEDGKTYEVVKYADLTKWWAEIAAETGTKLYMGQGLYRYRDEGNWSNPEEIINQLRYNQNHQNIVGTIFFTYKHLYLDDTPSLVEARKQLKALWTKPARPV